MQFALKSTLALIALYLLALGALAVWIDRELRSVGSSLMEGTAQLVGTQIAAAMSGSALDELLVAGPVTRRRLTQLATDLSQGSDVVASITVVNHDGQVVVSDDLEIGRQLMLPELVFQGKPEPQFLGSASPFSGGTYHLFVPLMRDHDIVGYIRLSLHSQSMVALYQRARRQIILAALAGLSAIVMLGALLHVRLSRRDRALAATLEATARGEAVALKRGRDEFSAALEAAGRLGRELSETRERSSQAQRRINALAGFLDVGLLVVGSDQRIEFASAGARKLLGGSSPEALQAQWTTVFPLLSGAVAQLSAGGAPSARADVELIEAGRVRRLRFEVHPPGDEGGEGFHILVKDRDLLDAYETDLRLATQMRGLARVYSALAHELKAPLSAMALNVELLNDTLQSDDDGGPDARPRQQRYARVLREELARLNRSLVSVLSHTASLDAQRERFDLRDLVHDLEVLLAPQARQQRVELHVNVPQTDVALSGHRDRLKQAFLNIATNALEAMPEGGRMDLSLKPRNQHVTVSIRDSGPGIPPEILERIYSMYFTTKSGGTGIGLYVARSIVESHGGEIEVDSAGGTGTCFQVTLPLTAAA